MLRFAMIASLILAVVSPAFAQTTQSTQPAPEVRAFELTPAAPPVPALKYELFYDILADRIPGNAAILYLQTALLLGTVTPDLVQEALAAHDANDMAKFNELANQLGRPALFKNLDIAARRAECDWEPPIRELGAQALLPHLQPIAHGLTRMTKVRALHQIEQGKADDAIATLRLGYEMADKVGQEPVLISGMVSLSITTQMNDALVRLMSRPESPNLYWALCEFPDRRSIFRNSFYGERRFLVAGTPHLADAMAGKDLAPQQWRALLAEIASLHAAAGDERPAADPVKDATPQNLQRARELYAQQRGLKPEQVEKLEAVVVLGNLYVHQAEVASDEIFKLRNLPYPLLLKHARDLRQQQAKLKEQTPGTPFLPMLDMADATLRFARVDRQLAALANVEAIRSYAAANAGKLPQRLDEITQTPALENPLTGEPFEYAVEGDVATLSDSRSQPPLTYTIRIRK